MGQLADGTNPSIRVEAAQDYASIAHLHRVAFGGEDEARLVDLLRAGASFIAELSLVAEEDGAVVGHALFSRAEIDGDLSPVEILVLAPIGVRPDRQRQGVGTALMKEGLRRARQMGFVAVVLIGHPEYYPRFGFRPGREYGLKTTYDVPDEVFMALELQSGGLEGVSGTVFYPPEFESA